ncbi:MAG: winged helix-turn-helix domain-containing protein [Anaerolineae bacterium]|nr:winged helix-turn-helix domain-containing protein [Anaerolineae bacterium]MDW8101395.1 winged helix-turn-helix domain-containing protein [Anaerolineae bacterium]
MLRKILEEIASGKAISLRELANHLGLEEKIVKAMLEDLELRGYLSSRSPECSFHCEGCTLRETCGVAGIDRIWFLTEKGRKTIKEEKHG